jgi:branched-chain amino acid transport system substrate-binding protein
VPNDLLPTRDARVATLATRSRTMTQATGRPNRRRILQTSMTLAAVSALGTPALLRAQTEKIKIGHLTPMTGFLGALGEYSVMGIKMATEEINAAGGVMGRQLDVMSEDSVNPSVAASKAQRMIERDGVAVLMGEISSASALTIAQVAARNKKLFMSIGARSDVLRGKDCNRYTFHVDIPVTVMVNAVGQSLVRDDMVRGKKFFSLTADYLFGHDLAKAAKRFFAANGGNLIGDELVPTDVTDFSPYLLKIRQARPDVVSLNLAGNQVTNFVKQYAEFGLPYPVVGFNLNTADAWAAGEGNLGGIWPTVWHHDLQTPGSKAFVAAFTKKYGKPPENHAWIEYVSLKMLVQAMNETKSIDSEKLIAYFESEAQFDILKARKGYFRSWDHQLMQEAYPFTVKPKGQARDKWDFLKFGEAVPAPNQPLELLAPTKAENTCVM